MQRTSLGLQDPAQVGGFACLLSPSLAALVGGGWGGRVPGEEEGSLQM